MAVDMLYLHRTTVLRMGIKVENSSLVLVLNPANIYVKIYYFSDEHTCVLRKVQSHLYFEIFLRRVEFVRI